MTERDRLYYERIGVPAPKLDVFERHRRRSLFRNERVLYKRRCDATGETVVSIYSSDKPYKVFKSDYWWGDQWDPLNYGRDFDFSRTMFDQFKDLMLEVPHMNMMLSHCENSDYAPHCVWCKNAYMAISGTRSEDIYYTYQANNCRDCVDCSLCYDCELCYECVYGFKLYRCFWSTDCRDSSELYFSRDCSGCKKCIGCTNLKNKELHIFNKPVSEQEFDQFVEKLRTVEGLKDMKSKFEDVSEAQSFRSTHNINCEDCVGDHLINCKNSFFCFEAENLEDCAYIQTLPIGAKDCYDIQYSPGAELTYESISAVNAYSCIGLSACWDIRESFYSYYCFYSSNLFGCFGLRNKKYCILNKQYTEEGYKQMMAKIIEHMKDTGEWGEFFAKDVSPFCYNETLAQDLYPLTKQQALDMGYSWKDEVQPQFRRDDTVKTCVVTGKPFKLIPQELAFYERVGMPIPEKCFDQRFTERLQRRNRHAMYQVPCVKSGKQIWTSYNPSEARNILSEDIYISEFY